MIKYFSCDRCGKLVPYLSVEQIRLCKECDDWLEDFMKQQEDEDGK